ncbi:nuclease-related domain-containing DEAD/DEAH box helicase [Planococcus versutus]|uniref:Uncharacterized protein n=1 Tax=Planococcus versutus TaxID=1302659 RepID=A0A1B1RZE5_9BACL|nr:NERD domain-containing protein/DEAD/DEAH box helicase [Planococcus versutus]ANU26313.1 hypothetical protein I858_004605 [Planococcus versutus]
MVILVPTIENIRKLRQRPTQGEENLLALLQKLNDEYTVYFQPFLNGSMPDFIILHRIKGILLIEVKDWNLKLYNIMDKKWSLKSNDKARIKSPLKQVKDYKDHIHSFINGFVEESVHDPRKFGYVQTAVYFDLLNEKESLEFCMECKSYNEKIHILGKDSINTDRFRELSYFKRNLSDEFTSRYYEEFQLLFAPSVHMLELGQEIKYSKSQNKLIKSRKEEIKIKGVAGSGKTFVLAKRAVSAHIRTKGRVLILTYNITLRNFIRDKLSQVREEFSWDMFHIDNYHNFIGTMSNEYGIDSIAYDDTKLFDGVETQKYQSIFIDEIQDYNLEWQTIIKKYFLAENGELVVFGDEKQNIYGNILDEQNTSTIVEDKEWKVLNESYRLSTVINDLSINYYEKYLKNRYLRLEYTMQQELSFNIGDISEVNINGSKDILRYCEYILEYIRKHKIPNNDVVILARHISTLRDIENIFRIQYGLSVTKTFEKLETYNHLLAKYGEDSWQFKEEIRKVRKNEKFAFQMNRGTIKMSTIHSFKGWEAENVFLFLENPLGEEELVDEEIIYTGITRSKNRLIFLNKHDTKYKQLFSENREIVKEINITLNSLPNKDFFDEETTNFDSIKDLHSIEINESANENFIEFAGDYESESDYWERIAEDSDMTLEEYFNSMD